jgi:hypothetical protein
MLLSYYSCVLCSQNSLETLLRLFFGCPFAMACWNTLQLIVTDTDDMLSNVVSFRTQLGLPFFKEIIITMCRSIWAVRNDVIFRGIPASVQSCRSTFKSESALAILRAKSKFHPAIDSWLEAYV